MDPAAVTILVVDDEPDALATVAVCLRAAGYDVTCATNGREASRLIDRQFFDVVITDMLMPHADGVELLMHLKTKQPRPAVVAVSGGGNYLAASDMLSMAIKIGATAKLAKPFTPRQLLNAVKSVCAKQPPEPKLK